MAVSKSAVAANDGTEQIAPLVNGRRHINKERTQNTLCPPDILQRARLIRLDFDRLPWLDGDLDTEGSFRLIARIGKHVNDEMARLALYRRRVA